MCILWKCKWYFEWSGTWPDSLVPSLDKDTGHETNGLKQKFGGIDHSWDNNNYCQFTWGFYTCYCVRVQVSLHHSNSSLSHPSVTQYSDCGCSHRPKCLQSQLPSRTLWFGRGLGTCWSDEHSRGQLLQLQRWPPSSSTAGTAVGGSIRS